MTDRRKTILALIGLYCLLNDNDKEKYIAIMELIFPEQFKEIKEK